MNMMENFDYLCKRASFVWKDVLNLTQFFIEGGGSSSRRRSIVNHLFIPVDEKALE